jgi:hypothetical protein
MTPAPFKKATDPIDAVNTATGSLQIPLQGLSFVSSRSTTGHPITAVSIAWSTTKIAHIHICSLSIFWALSAAHFNTLLFFFLNLTTSLNTTLTAIFRWCMLVLVVVSV